MEGRTHTREEVYRVLDGERAYQISVWGDRHDENEALGNFLLYIDVYLQKAKVALTQGIGDGPALDVLRKVTALGVAAMEQFGSIPRDGF